MKIAERVYNAAYEQLCQTLVNDSQSFKIGFYFGADWAYNHPAWRMCEDEMPTDPHQPYWVYAKCCGECCVAYLQDKTNVFYDEGGEELSGVVAWLPLPKFNIKAAEL